VVITCGYLSPGVASEAAFALKTKRPLILLAPDPDAEAFFGGAQIARSPEEAIELVRKIVG